ncbi:uncharacterized protein Z520_01163 [Fonsecaea multimorphosa CBS 102226]|uniref:Heterokaryon incompatibility domain-containing protein n=1 Tax=Fonsecaea multimorphosa CBS 102226 TaxID=1442371 RepID=A0A0D2K9F7_9EURO|nr:uncharacterized protein Z520_01163 [Fonsecaea multimorphosa CBS 102226]KIY02698.1 hypothetical protein Z520_01163 [Fonsecaea multimorphosa CBS 102226]
MGDIFKQAQVVVAWLGAGDDDTNYAMDHIGNPQPQTDYNPLIFSECAEKLLRATYWTRRWVIQEFALAREIKVTCGQHLIGWDRFANKINDEILSIGVPAKQTLESFKRLRSPEPQWRMRLLELMDLFQDARCAEQLDRVFALRSLAVDLQWLSPDYRETVSNLYFQLLSRLPTERVVPEMYGYRWPHEAASRLLRCMQMTKDNILNSLKGTSTDRLFVVFEYVGSVAKVSTVSQSSTEDLLGDNFTSFPLEVQLHGDPPPVLRGSIGLLPGDLVYSLRSTSRSPKGFYIAFRPSVMDQAVTGMIIEWPEKNKKWEGDYPWATRLPNEELRGKRVESIKHVVLGGVSKCSRNNAAFSSPSHPRVLCHINRVALILLWLLDAQQLDHLWAIREKIEKDLVTTRPSCNCAGDKLGPQEHGPGTGEHQNRTIEILPSSEFYMDKFWAEEMTPPWIDQVQHAQQEQLEDEGFSREFKDNPFNFNCLDETPLFHAAKAGFLLSVKHLVSGGNVRVNWRNSREQTPLLVTALKGYDEVVKFLMDAGADVNVQDKGGLTALMAASLSGYDKVVKSLVDAGVNLDTEAGYHLAPLKRFGLYCPEIVKFMVDGRGYIDAYAEDEFDYGAEHVAAFKKLAERLIDTRTAIKAPDGPSETALRLASDGGYDEVVKILVDAGANIDLQDKYGESALLKASGRGFDKVILIDAGANIDLQDEYGKSALLKASGRGFDKVVKILVDAGADINGALVEASSANRVAAARILLDAWGNELPREKLDKALLVAAEHGRVEMVELLLGTLANINAEFEKSALQGAIKAASGMRYPNDRAKEGRKSVVKLLREALARLDN